MPITGFLSCTRVFNNFESLSPAQRHHAKTYATGLVAASNKTMAGIAREVLPAGDKRALNKFLTEYDWDEQQFNRERVEEREKTRRNTLVEGRLHHPRRHDYRESRG